ncbi:MULTISPECIES: M24 family metallopeptidase [Marivita]|uniref:Aminopeptidase P family protein n=1 Tax=Marivita cryptomonadis TaxID=505252 RepID=A0A9Q2NZ47_9RHOB|nr:MULTISPECIES: Xaa-Pro peptidase family protein [Marivita]MCR9170482.1 Xaa-Pro peptidase family protein [Paracoccaceae bacterium]MBM2321427.1 aminopeptidase P family protein [Marivita cryptomonadis]MBM2331008.1 aminopeptidase P family protein [Marivita cryptomonadis]MBM2340594.1 aminopeptidase P family protein [Marivita cryptomonadis]MBM2345256.1 aminopeptidase P family protein [Marivita cryptomonadis]
MLDEAIKRTSVLQSRLKDEGISHAVFTSESSIAYLAGFWGYLGIEFGRPTMLVVPAEDAPIVITPLMESEMVSEMTWVKDVRTWEDIGQRSWGRALASALPDAPSEIWIEKNDVPAIVRNFLDERYPDAKIKDIGPILGAQRMIKSPLEIEVMKQAGEIAGAMMAAAHGSLRAGAHEYESAIAVIEAGTRKAAGFLTDKGWERFVSPMIHNLQILQSGKDASMVHRRASVKAYEPLDPVYFCFCNMAQFKQYKLGFDRMFHIGGVTEDGARVQQAAIDAQQAAIAVIRPGITAEEVAAAANAVYAERGYQTGYRTGRSIGVAYLEAPELKAGDTTVLKPGMTFAVDGGISVDGVTAGRIGDSIVVTETGSDYLTQYPRELLVTDA